MQTGHCEPLMLTAAVSSLIPSKSSTAPTTPRMNRHTTQTRVFDPSGNETRFALHVSLRAQQPQSVHSSIRDGSLTSPEYLDLRTTRPSRDRVFPGKHLPHTHTVPMMFFSNKYTQGITGGDLRVVEDNKWLFLRGLSQYAEDDHWRA